MSLPNRLRGVKVLKAVSSPLRLQVLNFIFDRGSLSYTELMSSLKMNPSRDAGRFAYHLKSLLKADLVEADVETKKYVLTELGKMVIDVAERVEKKAFKSKGMLIRTSHSTLEEFEVNKIANSLIKEAKMPSELAQKTAKDAERLLLKSRIRYLTAPLVREVVNTILVEKGFEDYRHKLTRLGMPVHEVGAMIEAKGEIQDSASILLDKAGKNVLSEYTLLSVFPRDISDAHASGAIHVSDLGTWLLKPDEVMHDLRFFLQYGVRPLVSFHHAEGAPQNFESALSVVLNVLLHTNEEINKMQTCPYFNVLLSPFAKGIEVSKLKDNLRLFIQSVNQHVEATFGLSLSVPTFLMDKQAIGPSRNTSGNYGDFQEESQLLAGLVIDVLLEESSSKPLLNPKIIIEVSSETVKDENTQTVLLKAHRLAAGMGIVYFLNTTGKEGKISTFSGRGCKYQNELSGDWETDVLRTGCIGTVNISLPRIAQESARDKTRFLEILRERYELAGRALEIKQRTAKQHGKSALPFLSQSANGDSYFRFENCLGIINLVGLKESLEAFSEIGVKSAESIEPQEDIARTVLGFKGKTARRLGRRLFTAMLPDQTASGRMAQLDIEKYGLAKVRFSGNREKPFYSTVNRLQVERNSALVISCKALESQLKLKSFAIGGTIGVIELEQPEYKPEELMNLTCQLIGKQDVEFFTYNRKMSYCSNCERSYSGTLHKCLSCGAISSLTFVDRFSYT